MLDIKFIRENRDIVEASAKNRGRNLDLDELISLDDKRLASLVSVEALRAEQNQVSNKIKVEKDDTTRFQMIEEMKVLKEDLKKREDDLKEIIEAWQKAMLQIPNIVSVDTPIGPDESGNKVVRTWGEKPQFSFTPKEHDELGEALDIIDTKTATEVAGPRLAYIKGDLVRIQFALIQMCLEIMTNVETLQKIADDAKVSVKVTPFMPVLPPVFIKPVMQVKMARFMTPEEHYLFPNDDLMLVGSAEHTLGAMYADTIFTEADMPLRYLGYSTAFRREAGSYGRDTKGIIRQHQFDKLEMETFCLPENSIQEQDFLVAIQEYVLQKLKLPYQVVAVCTGDMGFPDVRQLDIETWMPGQNKYRETHSADLIGSFQSRRLGTRIKRADGKIEPVHMNDATLFAMGRTMVAIIENYQNEDGSITIPEVLRPYIGKDKITLE